MRTGNRGEEFAELTGRALWLLEHAEEAEPQQAISHLGTGLWLWHYPEFESYRSWLVLVSRPEARKIEQPMVREVAWNRAQDWQRFNDRLKAGAGEFDTRPTINVRDAYLPIRDLKTLLEVGIELDAPTPGKPRPTDEYGESFGLEGYGPLHGIRMQWWSDGPSEWRELIAWAAQMREFLKRCLNRPEYDSVLT